MALPYRFTSQQIIEDGRTTQTDIDAIKNWLNITTLPELQDEFISLFLLSCDNDLADTKTTIESYFKIKKGAPHIFNNCVLDSEEILNIQKVVGICVVPTRMNNKTVVICAKLLDSNYRRCNIVAAMKLAIMHAHFIQLDDPPDDLVVVFDMDGIGFMHLTCLRVASVISYLKYVQDGVPIKIRDIHILNSNYVFNRALDLFKVFIKSELMDIVRTYPPGMDMETFRKQWIPSSCLPKDYGGDLPCFDSLIAATVKELKTTQEFFEAEENLRKGYKHMS